MQQIMQHDTRRHLRTCLENIWVLSAEFDSPPSLKGMGSRELGENREVSKLNPVHQEATPLAMS